jgi:AcrR family transcriptional regulator
MPAPARMSAVADATGTSPHGGGDKVPTLTARGKRTREALLSASRVIFERDGYLAARITDIADEARVSHGTFYTYFDSKLEIFMALAKEVRKELSETSAPHLRTDLDDPVEQIRTANEGFIKSYLDNARLMLAYEQVASIEPEMAALQRDGSREFTDRAMRLIKHLQRDGWARSDIDPLHVAAALTGMVGRFCQNWANGYYEFDMERAVSELSGIWVRAIAK